MSHRVKVEFSFFCDSDSSLDVRSAVETVLREGSDMFSCHAWDVDIEQVTEICSVCDEHECKGCDV